MQWVRAQAKRDTEARVARARDRIEAAEIGAENERRASSARAEDAEQVRLGNRLSDAEFERVMWKCFEEVEREDGKES